MLGEEEVGGRRARISPPTTPRARRCVCLGVGWCVEMRIRPSTQASRVLLPREVSRNCAASGIDPFRPREYPIEKYKFGSRILKGRSPLILNSCLIFSKGELATAAGNAESHSRHNKSRQSGRDERYRSLALPKGREIKWSGSGEVIEK